jgi:hypothetical protein
MKSIKLTNKFNNTAKRLTICSPQPKRRADAVRAAAPADMSRSKNIYKKKIKNTAKRLTSCSPQNKRSADMSRPMAIDIEKPHATCRRAAS